MNINKLLEKLFPLLLGVLFTLILTWPLILNLSTFYKDKGDYPLIGWILWHNQKALSEGFILDQVKYFDAGQFYPYPFSLAYSEHFFMPSVLFTIINSQLYDLVFSINTIFFLSFIFTFVSSYYSINYMVRNKFASITGAFVFTFNPLAFAHFADHFHLMNRYFLPPLFLFCYLFLTKPNLKNSLLFFTFFTFNALTSIHFGIFSSIIVLFLTLFYVVIQIMKKNYSQLFVMFKFGFLIFLFLPIILFFYLPYQEFSNKEKVTRPLSEVVYYSARLIDFVSPHPDSLLYGQFYRVIEKWRTPKDNSGYFNFSEHTLFPNLLPIFLFSAGIYLSVKFYRNKPLLLFYIFIAILTLIFTFGPLFTSWNYGGGETKLPYFFLYKYLSLIRSIRVPTRFEFIFYIPFSLFVAFGFYYLHKNIRSSFKLLFFIVTIIILNLENIHILSFSEKSQILEKFNNREFIERLAFLKDKNTIHLPLNLDNSQNESRYLTWSTMTSEKIFNGYSGYSPIGRDRFIEKINEFDEAALEKLSAIEIEYVIFHKDLISNFNNIYGDKIDLYLQGKAFENKEVLIIDLKKFYFNTKRCTNRDNLSVQLISKASYVRAKENFYQILPRIKLDNNGNCFFISTFRERYLPFRFDSREDEIYIILPILLEPKEAIEVAI